MGGFGDFLFGSSDSGSVENFETLTPAQRSLLDNLINQISPQIGKGVSSYPGTTVAGVNSNLQSTFDLASQFLSGEGVYGQTSDLFSNLSQPYDPTEALNFFNESVKTPALETWKQDILPDIKEEFFSIDAQDSGAARRAIARSGEDLATNLSSILGNLVYQGSESSKDRQAALIPSGLSIAGFPIDVGTSTGSLQRSIESEQLQEPYQKWLTEQPYNNPWLNYLSFGLNTQAQTPLVTGASSSSGLLSSLLPAAGTALGGYLGGKASSNALTSLLPLLAK